MTLQGQTRVCSLCVCHLPNCAFNWGQLPVTDFNGQGSLGVPVVTAGSSTTPIIPGFFVMCIWMSFPLTVYILKSSWISCSEMWWEVASELRGWETCACWSHSLYKKDPELHSRCLVSICWWVKSEDVFFFTVFGGLPLGSSVSNSRTGLSQLTMAQTSWNLTWFAQNRCRLFSSGSLHQKTPQHGLPMLRPSSTMAWHFPASGLWKKILLQH